MKLSHQIKDSYNIKHTSNNINYYFTSLSTNSHFTSECKLSNYVMKWINNLYGNSINYEFNVTIALLIGKVYFIKSFPY